MIGNPTVLSVDPSWKSFIEHCKSLDAYTGHPFDPPDDDVVDAVTSDLFNSLSFHENDEEYIEFDVSEKPFRRDD